MPLSHIAYHYLYARQYEEAIREYQLDHQLYADVAPVTHIRLGQAYYQKGMLKEAVAEYLQGFAGTGSPPDKIAELRKAVASSGIRGAGGNVFEEESK